jgi:hypothetical protein
MRLWILPIVALVGFGFGCEKKSPEGGQPGTDNKFNVGVPSVSKDIKQGTTETYEGSITRGKDFKKDVKLKATVPPESKLKVTLKKDEIKASDTDLKYSIVVEAAKDSPAGKHAITITGTPSEGSATSEKFEVNVTG